MMGEGGYSEGLLFEAETPIGFTVRVTRTGWQLITGIKHPVMAGHEEEVKGALERPDEIRLSKTDSSVYLFYSLRGPRRWVCAVAKRLNGDGFLITAYPTDAIKEGVRIWPK